MDTTTVSSKFQVVIPKRVRRLMGISPGQKLQVIAYGERIELLPLEPMDAARGSLRGIDTDIEREADRF